MFLKDGPNLRPLPKKFLTNFNPVLNFDPNSLTAFDNILHIPSNPLSLIRTYFFRLFHPVLLNLGYVVTVDFIGKVNVYGHVFLHPVSEGFRGYQRIPSASNKNSRSLTELAVVQVACCRLSVERLVTMG